MHDIVQDYYGNQLKNSDDLKTNACCDTNQTPAWLKPLLSRDSSRNTFTLLWLRFDLPSST